MFHRSMPVAVATGSLLALAAAAPAWAAPVDIGSGPATVQVLINWPDGFIADYRAHYGASISDTISGYAASVAADTADPSLAMAWVNFAPIQDPPNYFLNVATYAGGHSGDSATYDFNTAPENFWHQWIDTGSGWTFGGGASTDMLADGQRIGWVFGLATTPVPEPVSGMVLAVAAGGVLLGRRGRDEVN